MDEAAKVNAQGAEPDLIYDEDSAQLFATMHRRPLTDAEARMISERSKQYHLRKTIRRIIETLPVIITALTGLLTTLMR